MLSAFAMLVPWPVLSSLSSRNGSKTGSLHSPEAASPSDTLFPRSRTQGSQWSARAKLKTRNGRWLAMIKSAVE
ncbi:hypothetical protein Ddc_17535 [Ditylenchus destructor]|nr:hypothetical protein Ddc_17997 [Ditylenchus destructor]KAI1701606.1 hypothetical protein Ddc_17535 [Ditylenchus destructor]